jgi:hypothetical protein
MYYACTLIGAIVGGYRIVPLAMLMAAFSLDSPNVRPAAAVPLAAVVAVAGTLVGVAGGAFGGWLLDNCIHFAVHRY